MLGLGDADGSLSIPAVFEYQVRTGPPMSICNFNIAVAAWGNFKPGINFNSLLAMCNYFLSIDIASIGGGVDVALVALRGVKGWHSRTEEGGAGGG